MQQLQSSKAASLWSYFLNICAIPRPSKHEQKITQWIVDWASDKKIPCRQDKAGNLILSKPASAGYQRKTPVTLQAHLDMVPQKNNDKKHDFLTDPITPIITDGWLHADDTTLGADNGIGMASCLAVLADNTLEHGPLEVLLTADEETGMTGAFALEADALKGKILINTDSEQEGELYVGCAGGINVNINFPYEKMESDPTYSAYKISLEGLKGGHSGVDINLQRGNALKCLIDVLTNLDAITFHLAFFEGGSLRNAIPREAHAIIVCPQEYQNSLDIIINTLQIELQNKFQGSEDNLKLTIKECEAPLSVLTSKSQTNLLACLHDCENGVFAMDCNFSDVVQTSSNLGVITQHNCSPTYFDMEILIRSQIEHEKQLRADKIITHFEQYGGKCVKEGNYPGWKPNPNSVIYQIMAAQYRELFNKEPETMIIHAGLECGLFSEKYPQWDMISFGPTIKFPHSPDEKVNIASVDKYWQLLVATLKAID